MTRTVALMGTLVTIDVVDRVGRDQPVRGADRAIERAFDWFRRVEAACSRFDRDSELVALASQVGVPVAASDILYEAVSFALAVAGASGGAFDPTVGVLMEARGYNREYRTNRAISTGVEAGRDVSYRDVSVDPDRRTITLRQPLLVDLGAVAKGLAIDLAAGELGAWRDYAIDAGGDLYLGGHNLSGEPWSVGIRHPRQDHALLDTVRVSNQAVCTSGDYERRDAADPDRHHILDPLTGASAKGVASVTVIAPTAMAADGLATAAFVLGPVEGIRLLERQGVDGLIVSPTLERYATDGFRGGGEAFLSNAEGLPHHHLHGARPRRRDGRGLARRSRAG